MFSFLVLFGLCTVSIYYLCKQKRQFKNNVPPGIGVPFFASPHASFSLPALSTYYVLASHREEKEGNGHLESCQGQRQGHLGKHRGREAYPLLDGGRNQSRSERQQEDEPGRREEEKVQTQVLGMGALSRSQVG